MKAPRPLVQYEIGLDVPSAANLREHHHAKARRVKSQREIARLWTKARAGLVLAKLELPLTLVLVRVAPRELDSDNLASSLKAVRDGITEELRVSMPKSQRPRDDRDQLTWHYGQRKPRKGEREGVEVRLYATGAVLAEILRVVDPSAQGLLSDVLAWLAQFAPELDGLLVKEVG